MGGQACVLYGGVEFSRDADLAILADQENLNRFQAARDELQAECIAVPPFEKRYLDMGLAVHFRCRHPQALNLRVDVMSRMRGVDDFAALWNRRTTLQLANEIIELLSLPDLVRAKKTQRDKDWVMITRLLQASYFQNRSHPTTEQINFWLKEMRTPSLLKEVSARFPKEWEQLLPLRPLLTLARMENEETLFKALKEEEERERADDRNYWLPLRKVLEALRNKRREEG